MSIYYRSRSVPNFKSLIYCQARRAEFSAVFREIIGEVTIHVRIIVCSRALLSDGTYPLRFLTFLPRAEPQNFFSTPLHCQSSL